MSVLLAVFCIHKKEIIMPTMCFFSSFVVALEEHFFRQISGLSCSKVTFSWIAKWFLTNSVRFVGAISCELSVTLGKNRVRIFCWHFSTTLYLLPMFFFKREVDNEVSLRMRCASGELISSSQPKRDTSHLRHHQSETICRASIFLSQPIY